MIANAKEKNNSGQPERKENNEMPILNSNSKKVSNIIRSEIMSYFKGKDYQLPNGVKKTALNNMIFQAQFINGSSKMSNYRKGIEMVNQGYFACYPGQQAKLLVKIYGKKKVDNWMKTDHMKIHEIYAHLIGREFDNMIKSNNHGFIKKKMRG